MSKQIEAMKQSIIEEASIQMTGHPSKDARFFAKSVYEYLMAEQPAQEPVAVLYGSLPVYDKPTQPDHIRDTTQMVEQPAQPLSDEQKDARRWRYIRQKHANWPELDECARELDGGLDEAVDKAIEAAHGITTKGGEA